MGDESDDADYITPEITNAIEFSFVIPYDIPDDRTTASIKCYDDDPDANHLTIYASSLMSKGWGNGNCWYNGVDSEHKHELLCEKIRKLSKGSVNYIAF